MPQGAFKFREPKPIPRRLESGGHHARARQEQRISHLAESQPSREGRHGKQRRPPEDPRQRARELGVAHRVGRHRVDRTVKRVLAKGLMNGPDGVIQGNPACELAAIADAPAHPEPERQKQLLESAAARAEDHAEAEVDHADARPGRRPGRRLPLPADVGRKPVLGALASVKISAPRSP